MPNTRNFQPSSHPSTHPPTQNSTHTHTHGAFSSCQRSTAMTNSRLSCWPTCRLLLGAPTSCALLKHFILRSRRLTYEFTDIRLQIGFRKNLPDNRRNRAQSRAAESRHSNRATARAPGQVRRRTRRIRTCEANRASFWPREARAHC